MNDIRNRLLAKLKASGNINELTFKFKIASTDESRIKTVLNLMEVYNILPQDKCKLKDSKESINFRKEANTIFVSSKDDIDKLLASWELYSKSIAVAPVTSQELSLAYANRSALLFSLKKYEECIDDIDRALKLNYPNHLKGKILLRKIDCLYFCNNRLHIADAIEEVNRWLEVINISNHEKSLFHEKLQLSKSKVACLNLFVKNEDKRISPKIVCNDLVPTALDGLVIQYNDTFGRHIVTNRKINAGEILFIEKPYATMLTLEKVYTHCSHCLNVHWALIPCEFCIYAMYCSQRCKIEAWTQYHDIECTITGYLKELNYNKCALFSLRLSILALRESGTIDILKHYLQQTNTYQDPFRNNLFENTYKNKYYSLYKLVTNAEKRPVSDIFEKALNATFILYYLCAHTTLFGKKFELGIREISTNQHATYFGGLILHNMQIIPSNMHSVFFHTYYNFKRF